MSSHHRAFLFHAELQQGEPQYLMSLRSVHPHVHTCARTCMFVALAEWAILHCEAHLQACYGPHHAQPMTAPTGHSLALLGPSLPYYPWCTSLGIARPVDPSSGGLATMLEFMLVLMKQHDVTVPGLHPA